ncbi:putative HTH-type transcriptional regulator YqaF [Bacillus sp. J14TS2]|uniref:helix-turn-helix transcriptional regulator n=1 Tax=Bacillus sp. J14TS2 TaxID=2807188 RepID=UPI001B1C98C2|nr:helix-turn-helix transcriptional regulator [Bacillus sp. J14TS2]GIN71283.1 putative HTH-type transcriptional regulator YqaF [Bacillus sp. J14TS2]
MRNWLKSLRIQKGLTQQEIADIVNIERAYYTMIESGNRNPSVSVAKSIASAIGFDWTIFFELNSNEMKHNQ